MELGYSRKASWTPRIGGRRTFTDVGSSAEAPEQKKKRGEITLAQKIAARVNSLVCNYCKAKDTDPDPVAPQCRTLWSRYRLDPTRATAIMVVYTTEGMECAYCGRTKKARFMDYKSGDALVAKMGTDQDVCETFHRFRKWLIGKILASYEVTLGGCGVGE